MMDDKVVDNAALREIARALNVRPGGDYYLREIDKTLGSIAWGLRGYDSAGGAVSLVMMLARVADAVGRVADLLMDRKMKKGKSNVRKKPPARRRADRRRTLSPDEHPRRRSKRGLQR